jgi:hypothetical protein
MALQAQNSGLDRITAALAALNFFFGWGTGTGKTKSANAVTTTGTTEARVAASKVQVTTAVSNDTFRAYATIEAAAGRTISEIGLFDAAGSGSPPTGGNMNFYMDFDAITLAEGDLITATFDVRFGDADL